MTDRRDPDLTKALEALDAAQELYARYLQLTAPPTPIVALVLESLDEAIVIKPPRTDLPLSLQVST